MTERTDEELTTLALQTALTDPHGGEMPELNKLRRFTHAEMMAGRIDGATQDRIGELVDAIARALRPRIGDLIGPNATRIPWDVLEVECSEGDTWRRLYGPDRTVHSDDSDDPWVQEYDWTTSGGGGLSTTEGLIMYAPLRITRVAERPGEQVSDADIVVALFEQYDQLRRDGVPDDVLARMRRQHIADVRANPKAMEEVRQWKHEKEQGR